jgi:anti-sigma regulatory factor (Ser/Thr protein kinase)
MAADSGRQASPKEAVDVDGQSAVPAALEQDFDAGSLYALRSAVAAHSADAGLSPGRVYDVVAAAHELAANAIRHGAGHGRVRLWTADGALTCQVSDDGAAGGDRSPRAEEIEWPVQFSHGLWMVGQVTDRFTIDRDQAGTIATFTMTL